jgi:uncharacterized membrane protein
VRRILIVILGLAITGAVVGSVLGILSLWAASAILNGLPNAGAIPDIASNGAKAGALVGAVLVPISAWSLMRFAPLWRAIAEPALGTTLGAVIGSLAAAYMKVGLKWSIIGALAGFLLAAVHLRIVYRSSASPKGDSVSS